ncbi:MAG: amidase family protein [Candidatus Diapherotrites archaeon]|nr:amidase family protein [Candidatus Diapherotrites archaeon]
MRKTLSIKEFVSEVKKGNISVLEHTEQVLQQAEESNREHHHFNIIAKKEALKQAEEAEALIRTGRHKGKLLGLPVSVKDCICVKGIESRAGSKILSGYMPLFDATVIGKARAEGAIIIGKTAQDEFGFGTFSANVGVGFERPRNPLDPSRSCGGSSGGSAGFTALSSFAHASIAESTGGSIACPASFCGVVGLTPTYGRVSRYGLIDYANSLDKIGSIGKSVEDAALLLEVISGHDANDSTSLPEEALPLSSLRWESKFRVGVLRDFFEGCDDAVQKQCMRALDELEKHGAIVEEIELPLNAKYGIAAYYLISTAESSTNLARYCGMRYGLHERLEGNFNEYFSKVRSCGFGEEAKRRILLGTFARMAGFRDAYYLRAMKARTKLIGEFKRAFERFDLLANPTMPIAAPTFEEIGKLSPMQQYAMDLCTVPANLAGLPHASVPVGSGGKMPVGLMLTADHLQEEKLVKGALALEAVLK